MNEAKFKIGDRVLIIPSSTTGDVMECIYGARYDQWHYEVRRHDTQEVLTYSEAILDTAPIKKVYSFEAVVDAGAAIVTMFDVTDENAKTVVCRGHAHILHDGEVGMAQAVSFAARRMFEAMDRKEANPIYFGKNGGI